MALLELCTLDDVTNYPGLETIKANDKDWLERLIRGFSGRAEAFTSREFNKEIRTEQLSPNISSHVIQLRAYGTGTVTTVHEDYDRVFDASTLVDAEDYYWDAETGQLSRDGGTFFPGRGVVQVVYDAGLGTTVDDVPEDLRMAAILQCAFWFQRRNELGLTQRTQTGGAISVNSPSKLLPEVEDILWTHSLQTLGGGKKERLRFF